METRKPRVLLCVSGSVAAVKVPQLAVALRVFAEVKIVATKSSRHFLDLSRDYDSEAWAQWQVLAPPIELLGDEDEWKQWKKVGDPVLHIELRNWADMMLIAPLSANTLGKLANGICDTLLTCVARAWDLSQRKPFLVAPAMNTQMWLHPLTNRHIETLESFGVQVIAPAVKLLACGDTGVGALAEVEDIVSAVKTALSSGNTPGT